MIQMNEDIMRITAACAFLWAAAVPDLRNRKIPAWIPGVFFIAAAVADIYALMETGSRIIWTGVIPGMILLLFSAASGGQIGEGDGICLLVCGVLTGGRHAVRIAKGALIMAAMTGAVFLCTGRSRPEDRIAFVPFLAVSASILLLKMIIGNL